MQLSEFIEENAIPGDKEVSEKNDSFSQDEKRKRGQDVRGVLSADFSVPKFGEWWSRDLDHMSSICLAKTFLAHREYTH